MEFTLYIPTNIIGGEHCVRSNAHVFKKLGRRAFVMTGAKSAKASGALDDVTAALDAYKIAYDLFDEVRENPLLSTVVKAGQKAKQAKADYIIAIGGGSVLDAVRAASVFAVNDFAQAEDIYNGVFESHLPLVCVGTTAGTGSEVDNIAVITEDATGHKKAIKKDILFAEYAFADYRYTKSMTLRQTVSTALDALCHCFESWFNTAATEPVRCAARRGAELIYPWLKEISAGRFHPKEDAMRRDLYYGSLWGGIAIAHAGTGFPHPAGYALTELGGVPHGISCAVFEPAFLRHSFAYLDDATKKMFLCIDTLDAVCSTIEKLCENNITLSQNLCNAVAARAAQSANIQKTLGGYTEQSMKLLAENLFLNPQQVEDFKGQWMHDLN